MTSSNYIHPPDSLTGAILAIEGIRDAAVLLNGPTGCKFYHGSIAEGQLPRESSYDPLRFIEEFYFGQPRVPATYLEGNDYVFGSSGKLERILPVVAAKGHALVAVINSPGAALIGDDLEQFVTSAKLNIPYVTIESHTDGEKVYSNSITVTGLINDIVRGTIEESQATVTVNGVEAATHPSG